MREKVKDKERLTHILNAIDTLIENRDKYRFEEVVNIRLYSMAL